MRNPTPTPRRTVSHAHNACKTGARHHRHHPREVWTVVGEEGKGEKTCGVAQVTAAAGKD